VFGGIMPQHYAGTTGVTLLIHTLSTGTTGDMDWDAAFESLASQDHDSDGFAAVNSTDNTSVNGTSGVETVVSITFTDGADMDSVAAGNAFRLKITHDNTGDSNSDTLQITNVELRET